MRLVFSFFYHSIDLEETARLANCLANILSAGDTLLLCGDLGAGKTALTKLLLHNISKADVVSPTFTLMHTYQADFLVHHLDLYRLDREEEVWELGWQELFDGSALTIVEWADKFPELFPENYLMIKLSIFPESGERLIEISASGVRGSSVLQEVKQCLS